MRKRVANLQRQVVEARRREFDLQINSRLLEAEAKRRGVTKTKLLEAEVVAKTPEPTEAEAQEFFDENTGRACGLEFQAVKAKIVEYLRAERQQRPRREALRTRCAPPAQVKKNVEAATPPATEADRARVFATVNGQEHHLGRHRR